MRGCVYFFFYVWRRPTDKNCVKKCQKEYDIISIGLSPDQSTPKLWLKWRYKSQGLSLNFCNMVAFAYLSICMLFSPIFFPSSSVCMRVCLNAAGAHFSQHSIEPLCSCCPAPLFMPWWPHQLLPLKNLLQWRQPLFLHCSLSWNIVQQCKAWRGATIWY